MSDSRCLSKGIIRLFRAFGIYRGYHNIVGEYKECPIDVLFKMVSAMGYEIKDESQIESVLLKRKKDILLKVLPEVKVIKENKKNISLTLTLKKKVKEASFFLRYENKEEVEFRRELVKYREIKLDSDTWYRYKISLPENIPLGYHDLLLKDDTLEARSKIICVPEKCYLPDSLKKDSSKLWGVSAQLYSIRSSSNWGIGQFSDLSALIRIVSEAGGDFVGLNPFNALSMSNMDQNSPYSSTSRSFLNVYYIDCERMRDVQESNQARDVISSTKFQQKIKELRESPTVSYREVRALKNPIFELAYEHFLSTHLVNNTSRAKKFKTFIREKGELLETYALYEALSSHLWKPDFSAWGWPVWKSRYQDMNSKEVKEFKEENRETINYFKYLQWQAHAQLRDARKKTKDKKLTLGLYVDFSLSGDSGGCDVWRDRDIHASSVSVGAPPDDYNPKGQGWGFYPYIPHKLKQVAYRPYIEALRANMAYAGAIRIDHSMSMMRLFWIPDDLGAQFGAYIRYPYRDLMGIVSLESLRNKCMVVCEDLGVVSDFFREEISRRDMFSYKVFFFMKSSKNTFLPSSSYPEDSLVIGTTHDMFTLSGYWKGEDLELREKIGLINLEELKEEKRQRLEEKKGLLRLFKEEGLLSSDYDMEKSSSSEELDDKVFVALESFLFKTKGKLVVIPLEDLTGQVKQVNLPGTTSETYLSWSHRVPVRLQDLQETKKFLKLKEVLKNNTN